MRAPPISHKAMAMLGWTRTDPRPWGKLEAVWEHARGWQLRHCGHPTALWPWALYNPKGAMVLGINGKCWPDLRSAAAHVDAVLQGRTEARRCGPCGVELLPWDTGPRCDRCTDRRAS